MIVKVPGINGLNRTKGCEKASDKILEFLKDIHSNEKDNIIKKVDSEEIKINHDDLEEQQETIYKEAKKFLDDKVIFLGGDHSISYDLVRAFVDSSDKDPCLIIFDAHADCMPRNKEPTHEEWLRGVIEEGFPVNNILLIGSRNLYEEEIDFLEKNNIKRMSIDTLNNLQEAADIITEFASGKELYVSIDIDVIDPVFAPAVYYQEPGGLTSRQFVYLVKRLSNINNLKAVDIVEINVDKDEKYDYRTTKLGSKILAEFL